LSIIKNEKGWTNFRKTNAGVKMLKKFIIIVLFILVSFSSSNYKPSLADGEVNLFEEVINTVDGKVSEYGIKAVFETDKDKESYCLELLKKLEITGGNINIIKEDKFYCIDFNNNNTKGYIESMSYDNHNVVTLNIVQIDAENKLQELEKKVETAIGKKEKEVKYFKYLKAQFSSRDKSEVNRDIASMLKKHSAVNLDTVQIDNGYSTVAYTKKYLSMKNNGKLIDFNYAVCSYSSGDYIVIGTPVIVTTY
jgi:hypothetical protein